MVDVPTDTGLTRPVAEMVAMAVFPEVQVPPVVASVNVIVPPLQTVPGPEIGDTAGRALTVIVFVPNPEQMPLVSV